MTTVTISPAALFAAIKTATVDMEAAEEREDWHDACRLLDIAEAFTSAAARIRAVTEADRQAHQRLHMRVAGELTSHASGARPLNEFYLWRVIEDLAQLGERLLEQDQPTEAAAA